VPNRFEFGYGLTPEIVAVAAQRAPALLASLQSTLNNANEITVTTKQEVVALSRRLDTVTSQLQVALNSGTSSVLDITRQLDALVKLDGAKTDTLKVKLDRMPGTSPARAAGSAPAREIIAAKSDPVEVVPLPVRDEIRPAARDQVVREEIITALAATRPIAEPALRNSATSAFFLSEMSSCISGTPASSLWRLVPAWMTGSTVPSSSSDRFRHPFQAPAVTSISPLASAIAISLEPG